jgi:phosphoribosylformimino-5-aminoimidazole carboxamide ribonucleotide (ProFAR) isomerase
MAFRGDGEVIRTKKGRPERQKIIRFDTPEAQQEWSDAVVAALRAAHPGALA